MINSWFPCISAHARRRPQNIFLTLPTKFSNFSQVRLFLFICSAKTLWSLASVQLLTIAYKYRYLVLFSKCFLILCKCDSTFLHQWIILSVSETSFMQLVWLFAEMAVNVQCVPLLPSLPWIYLYNFIIKNKRMFSSNYCY